MVPVLWEIWPAILWLLLLQWLILAIPFRLNVV